MSTGIAINEIKIQKITIEICCQFFNDYNIVVIAGNLQPPGEKQRYFACN